MPGERHAYFFVVPLVAVELAAAAEVADADADPGAVADTEVLLAAADAEATALPDAAADAVRARELSAYKHRDMATGSD